MKALLVSDLHLTDRPADEYRWALFPFLAKAAREHSVSYVFYLGDILNDKDRNPARLLNRTVDGMHFVHTEGVRKSYVLRGNHDGIDPLSAQLRFLGKHPHFTFIETPFMFPLEGKEILMLPHSRDPVHDWEIVEMERADIVLMHATVRGTLAENGQALDGIPPGCLLRARKARIFSGDVHVPQKSGKVEYVGAPYPIRFGDKFKGRVILAEDWRKFTDLYPPSIQRCTISVGGKGLSAEQVQSLALASGDQVKVRVRLSESEYGDWQSAKEATVAACKAAGITLADVELERAESKGVAKASGGSVSKVAPAEVLRAFCLANKLGKEIEAVGLDLLKE